LTTFKQRSKIRNKQKFLALFAIRRTRTLQFRIGKYRAIFVINPLSEESQIFGWLLKMAIEQPREIFLKNLKFIGNFSMFGLAKEL
jgi:hypothetical protein